MAICGKFCVGARIVATATTRDHRGSLSSSEHHDTIGFAVQKKRGKAGCCRLLLHALTSDKTQFLDLEKSEGGESRLLLAATAC